MPDTAELFALAQVLGAVVLLVCIFMVVNNAALAAAEHLNKRK